MSDTALLTENYSCVPDFVECDFSLVCIDDSMMNARIFNGDTVFIRQQSDVDNGAIAAVCIEDGVILRRVFDYPNRLELRPENPLYEVLNYEGNERSKVCVLGKAVYFCCEIA